MRDIRFSVHWKFIETSPGIYNWDSFDARMAWAADNNLNVMLTIEANGPDWVCSDIKTETYCVFKDNVALARFVEALITRYADDIAFVQFGNEVLSADFYPGTVEDYVASQRAFYNAVRAITDELPVVLAGYSSGVVRRAAACIAGVQFPLFHHGQIYTDDALTTFCASGWVHDEASDIRFMLENASYDIVDLHFYDDAEYWPLQYSAWRTTLGDVPIMISEFGGPRTQNCDAELKRCLLGATETETLYSDAYHAARVALYMETVRQFDVITALYFKMIESGEVNQPHNRSGLFSLTDTNIPQEKSAYEVFRRMNTSEIESTSP